MYKVEVQSASYVLLFGWLGMDLSGYLHVKCGRLGRIGRCTNSCSSRASAEYVRACRVLYGLDGIINERYAGDAIQYERGSKSRFCLKVSADGC